MPWQVAIFHIQKYYKNVSEGNFLKLATYILYNLIKHINSGFWKLVNLSFFAKNKKCWKNLQISKSLKFQKSEVAVL